jgi:hypothetical protein
MIATSPCPTKINAGSHRIGTIIWTSQSDTNGTDRYFTISFRWEAIVNTAATMITSPLMMVWV